MERCWSCHSRASWVRPEVCKTKRNPAAWMNFPPGGEGKLAKLSVNIKNLWEQGRECQYYFSIIHHYGTFDYHCCKAYCVLTVSILPGNLQARCITATNSCVPRCNDISILCAKMRQSDGSKTLCLMCVPYWLSPCSQRPKWGQREVHSCRPWKERFNFSQGKQVQPDIT